MTQVQKFGKSAKAADGTTRQVGIWIASGYVSKDGQYHGQVRLASAHYRQTVDMNSADAILADVDGFISACVVACSQELEQARRDADRKAKTGAAPQDTKPAPVAQRFGKPGA